MTTIFTKLATVCKTSPMVTICIAREGSKLRVTVTPKHPKKLDEDDKVEPHEAALTHPLSMLGTAEELDAGFVDELDNYLGKRAEVVSELADYEEELAAAAAQLKGKNLESKKKRGATALPAPAVPANPQANALAQV